jgi:electron transfer flavoprotein alpha subunit
MSGSETVLVFAEAEQDVGLSRLTVELMGIGGWLASRTAGRLEAVVIGEGVAGATDQLLSLGAETVYAADHPAFSTYKPDAFVRVLTKLLDDKGPVTLLAGHTPIGQDLAPRLAFALGAGLVTDCCGIETDGTGAGPMFVKPVFGGNIMASLEVETPVRIATVRSRVGTAPAVAPKAGEIVSLGPPDGDERIEVLERVEESVGVNLETCPVIVAGGRGMGGPEGFDQLEELALIFGGAVGASRPPCDSGWAPTANQVGITGKIVAPDLYFAVAISGSSQHLSGMSESGKIVAINQDPEAYVFKVADYGAVGDWRRVLPAFAAGVKKHVQG